MGSAEKVVTTLTGGVVGHEKVIGLLARALDRGRLVHAYLFVGPSQVGKTTVARAFVESVLGGGAGLERHPDFTSVARCDDPKTGRPRSGIVIEQIRHLRSRLAMGALMNGWKAAIIEDAHRMNTESANALLKSLEEPHPRTLLVLLAPSPDAVMPTIRSRCQVMRFARVPSGLIERRLGERGVSGDEAARYARLSDGRPGRALGFVDDPEAFRAMLDLRETASVLLDAPLSEKLAAVDALLPPKFPFIEAGDRAIAVLDLMAELLRDALLCTLGRAESAVHADIGHRIGAVAERLDSGGVAVAVETVRRARTLIREHVNPRAALEHVAIALS